MINLMPRLVAFMAIIVIASTLWGCVRSSPKLVIAAAADLAAAFAELGQNFEQATGAKIEFSFGSTGMLAKQIENGAPFDVFAAADIKFIDNLNTKGKIIVDTQQRYARGRIGLVKLKGKLCQVKTLADLTRPEVKKIAIANPEHAPYGLAAKQVLANTGLWDKINDKLVYGNNIQDTLTLVLSGNAEIGIVARSLANRVDIDFLLLDDNLHAPLDQAIAVVKGASHEGLARQFIQYVNGPEGRIIMKKYGFVLPQEI